MRQRTAEYIWLLFSGFSQAPIHTHQTWLKWMGTFALNTLVLSRCRWEKKQEEEK